MQSPLDIKNTAKRYNLDKALTVQLRAFDDFIWQDCEIASVDQLVAYKRSTKSLKRGLISATIMKFASLGQLK